MRKEYGRALRRIFASKMKEVAKEFKETEVKSIYLGSGERAYCWTIDELTRCWIVLSPSQKGYDEFTILVGWSVLGRFPELSMIPSMIAPTDSREEYKQPEYLIRLPQLWTSKDIWWIIKRFRPALTIEHIQASIARIPDGEAESQVFPLVDDAIHKILNVGIPYLVEFAKTKDGRNG